MASGGARENAGRKPTVTKKMRYVTVYLEERVYKKLYKKHGKLLNAFIRQMLEKEI